MVIKIKWLNDWLAKLAVWFYCWKFNQKYRKANSTEWACRMDPRTVWAQILHETGNLKSDLYKRANNVCGMRVPIKRPWFGNGESNNYSTYFTTWQSVKDLYSWWTYTKIWEVMNNPMDPIAYAYWLKQFDFYEAPEDDYAYAMLALWDKYCFKMFNPWIMVIIIAILPTSLVVGYAFFPKCREFMKTTVKRIFQKNGN